MLLPCVCVCVCVRHEWNGREKELNRLPLAVPSIRECPLEGRKIARCACLVRLSRVEPPGGPKAEWEVAAMEAMIACIMDPEKPCFLASVVVSA